MTLSTHVIRLYSSQNSNIATIEYVQLLTLLQALKLRSINVHKQESIKILAEYGMISETSFSKTWLLRFRR